MAASSRRRLTPGWMERLVTLHQRIGDQIMRTAIACALTLSCAACQQSSPPVAAVDTAAASKAIEALENVQISSITAKQIDGATRLYADDAAFIGSNGKLTSGKDAITAMFKKSLADPADKIVYTPEAKIFSSSGDFFYNATATTETSTDEKTKKPVTITGTNLSVWR